MIHENHGRVTSSTFRYGHAEVTLEIDSDGTTAQLVNLHSGDRGHGHAKAVMMEAMHYADKHHVSVWLTVTPYNHQSGSLDDHQLALFFARFGFDIFDNVLDNQPAHTFMVREPLM